MVDSHIWKNADIRIYDGKGNDHRIESGAKTNVITVIEYFNSRVKIMHTKNNATLKTHELYQKEDGKIVIESGPALCTIT